MDTQPSCPYVVLPHARMFLECLCMLKHYKCPSLELRGSNVFQHDEALGHKASSMMTWCLRTWMVWFDHTHHLNPPERLWNELKFWPQATPPPFSPKIRAFSGTFLGMTWTSTEAQSRLIKSSGNLSQKNSIKAVNRSKATYGGWPSSHLCPCFWNRMFKDRLGWEGQVSMTSGHMLYEKR